MTLLKFSGHRLQKTQNLLQIIKMKKKKKWWSGIVECLRPEGVEWLAEKWEMNGCEEKNCWSV